MSAGERPTSHYPLGDGVIDGDPRVRKRRREGAHESRPGVGAEGFFRPRLQRPEIRVAVGRFGPTVTLRLQ